MKRFTIETEFRAVYRLPTRHGENHYGNDDRAAYERRHTNVVRFFQPNARKVYRFDGNEKSDGNGTRSPSTISVTKKPMRLRAIMAINAIPTRQPALMDIATNPGAA